MKSVHRRCAFGVFIAGAFCILAAHAAGADAASDRNEIQTAMKAVWDKPEAPLRVDPIVVAADHAIAGWLQGDMGGRALLRRKAGTWTIVLCSGDALKSPEALHQAALPKDVATTLARLLAEAESKLDPQVLAQFSRFEGLVMMDAAGHHPPHHR